MEVSDVIVIGGGMAGLSSAAFLAKCGRKVSVLEKHDKPGGLIASFERHGCLFDIGLEGLRELAPDSYMGQFLDWWDVRLPLETREENIAVHTAQGSYMLRGSSLEDDFRAAFPESHRRLNRYFKVNNRIVKELFSGGAPKPPYEMSLPEMLGFGLTAMVKRPALMRYGLRNCSRVLGNLLDDPEMARVAASKTIMDMVYLAIAYRWESVASGKVMYPVGGMGAIPLAVAEAIVRRGGEVLTGAEAIKTRQEGAAWVVECADGRIFKGKRLVIGAPMPWALGTLFGDDARFDSWRKRLVKKQAFPATFMLFAGLDPSFDLKGANYIADWGNERDWPAIWQAQHTGGQLSAQEAPLAVIAGGIRKPGETAIPLSILASLGWDYRDRWGTAGLPVRSWQGVPEGYQAHAAYQSIKRETQEIVLDRLESRLGSGFRQALRFTSASSPLSFARYTNNPAGSYMGFSIRQHEYGKFFPQQSPVPGVAFAGQWVFPGFGVAGVSASGYYLAKSVLRDEGTDLDAVLKGDS